MAISTPQNNFLPNGKFTVDAAVFLPHVAVMKANQNDLLKVCDRYADATGVSRSTLSHRIFGDVRKLGDILNGSTVTVSRFNKACDWLSTNWPDGLEWPQDVERPPVPVEDATVEAA